MKTISSWRPPSSPPLPPPPRRELHRLARRAAELAGLPVEGDWCASLRFVGDRTMARCNAAYVGHRGTTDVITFSYFDAPESLFPGDVGVELLICLDAALREGARRPGSSYAREVALYLVHGFLHAAGEDDLTPPARRRMRRREREVMAVLVEEFDLSKIFALPTA